MAFTTTPDNDRELRDAATSVIRKHSKELAGSSDVEAIIRNIDGLAFSLGRLPIEIRGLVYALVTLRTRLPLHD